MTPKKTICILVLFVFGLLAGCKSQKRFDTLNPIINSDNVGNPDSTRLHIEEYYDISDAALVDFVETMDGFIAVTEGSGLVYLDKSINVLKEEWYFELSERFERDLVLYRMDGNDLYTVVREWSPSERYHVYKNGDRVLTTDMWMNRDIVVDSGGNLYALANDDLFYLNSKISLSDFESADKEMRISSVFQHDGKVFAVLTEVSVAGEYESIAATYLCEVNGTTIENSMEIPLEGKVTSACSLDDSVVLLCDNVLYQYNNGEIKQYVDLIEIGVTESSVVRILQVDTGLVIVHSEGIVVLEEKIGSDNKPNIHSQTIRLAVPQYMSNDVIEAAARYNRLDTGYTVDVVEFAYEGNTMGLAIASGEQFDLICEINPALMDNYAESGILAPLDNVSFLNSDDLFQNVLEVWEKDNSRFYFSPAFDVLTVRMPESFLENGELTLNRLVDISEEYNLYSHSTKQSMLYCMLLMDGIDYWLEETSFTDESFITMLEYCKTFVDYDGLEAFPYSELLVDDLISIYPMLSLDLYESIEKWDSIYQEYHNSNAAFAKMPFVPYEGYAVGPSSFGYIGMCANGNQAGAESFLEYLVSENYYSGTAMLTWYLPLRWVSLGYDYQESYYEQIISIIEKADHASDCSEFIRSIILEEANSYFMDQNSAVECATNIQTRIEIYLSEQK